MLRITWTTMLMGLTAAQGCGSSHGMGPGRDEPNGGDAGRGDNGVLDAGAAESDTGPVEDDAAPDRPVDARVPATSDAGAEVPDARHVGVPCGAELCTAGEELCIGCRGDGSSPTVFCAPLDGPPRDIHQRHPQCGVRSLYLACDGHEDCAEGQACIVLYGEFGEAFCANADDYPYGHACDDASQCSPDHPSCDEFEGAYFEEFRGLLGWYPRTCQMSTSAGDDLCGALCDSGCPTPFGGDYREDCAAACEVATADCNAAERDRLWDCVNTCDRLYPCIDDVACSTDG